MADGAVEALTYALEIVTDVIASRRRWRMMPWLVLLFGIRSRTQERQRVSGGSLANPLGYWWAL